MLRSGALTGAKLKLAIKVTNAMTNNGESESENEEIKKDDASTLGINNFENEGSNKENQEMQLLLCKIIFKQLFDLEISEKFPYDITSERFMNAIIENHLSFKVRVYLLTCQNLSAVESNIDLRSRLAGYKALCSADPFPVLKVGDGINELGSNRVKFISERDKEVP
jgi:hypothetical protein